LHGLLEDHLGVRWFMPGECWEDVSLRTTVALEPIEDRQSPRFLRRIFSGIAQSLPARVTPGGVAFRESRAWEVHNRVS